MAMGLFSVKEDIANAVFYNLTTGKILNYDELERFSFNFNIMTSQEPELYYSGMYQKWGELNGKCYRYEYKKKNE